MAKRGVLSLVALCALAATLGGCQQAAQGRREPMKIGVVASVTGYLAQLGIAARDAAVYGADQINASGGIDGRQLQLIIEDDKSEPAASVAAVTKLINE